MAVVCATAGLPGGVVQSTSCPIPAQYSLALQSCRALLPVGLWCGGVCLSVVFVRWGILRPHLPLVVVEGVPSWMVGWHDEVGWHGE